MIEFLALLGVALASQVVSFLENQSPAKLELCYYTTEFGQFDDAPTNSIWPSQEGNWTTSGALYHNLGWIGYEVYYNITNAHQPVYLHLVYFWNVIYGICNFGFEDSCYGSVAAAGAHRLRPGAGAVRVDASCTLTVATSGCELSSPLFTLYCE